LVLLYCSKKQHLPQVLSPHSTTAAIGAFAPPIVTSDHLELESRPRPVIAAVILCVMITVAIAAIRLAPQMADGRVVFDVEPDHPAQFGQNMAWLAIRTRDTGAVLHAMGLTLEAEPANWSSGLGAVYDEALGQSLAFVSPPVNGWTLVVSASIPAPASRRFVDKSMPMLLGLSERFVEVQYFAGFPDIDFFAWARVIEGRLIRAFAINDEGTVWNKGRPTKEEKAMGLKLFEVRGMRERRGDAGGEIVMYPTSEHLMGLAQKWSLDPTHLEPGSAEPALGVIARVPASWRPERLARVA
jgi:hypothetical protein